MKPIYLSIALLLLCFGCKKLKYVDPNTTLTKAATCEVNGVPTTFYFGGFKNVGDTAIMLLLVRYDSVHSVMQNLQFVNFKTNYDKQYRSNDIDAPNYFDKFHIDFDMSIDDYGAGDGKVLQSDSLNNYIQVTQQEQHFTSNLKADFSVTLVAFFTTTPDTLRIRNGKIDLTGIQLIK